MIGGLFERVHNILLGIACAHDQHGPFSFPVQSFARTSALPPIHCLTCSANARAFFRIEHGEFGGVFVWNLRESPAVVIGWDDAITIPARAAAVFSSGSFRLADGRT